MDLSSPRPEHNEAIGQSGLLSRLCRILKQRLFPDFDRYRGAEVLSACFAHIRPGIWRISLYFAIGISIGFSYAKVVHTALVFGLINGVAITLFIGLFELFLESTKTGDRIRRTRYVVYVLAILIGWGGFILLSLEGVIHAFAQLGINSGDPLRHQARWTLLTDVVVAICFVFVVNYLGRIASLLGGSTLIGLLLGRYRRPLWENRVFLFIDIVGSTRLTQELGAAKAQSLFTEFFSDIDTPIRRFGGETHRYIGDEVVVTWPLNEADKAIETIKSIDTMMRRRSDYYVGKYGTVPRYRAGVHGGEIVSGQVGSQRKREIVYFGDTINTVARLTALTGEVGADALVSESLVNTLSRPCRELQPLGAFQLKGRSEPISVYQLVSAEN